jgi:hypothetical protein
MGYEWLVIVATGIVAAMGLYGTARLFRVRAARRWLVVLNAFADREIAEHDRWRVPSPRR